VVGIGWVGYVRKVLNADLRANGYPPIPADGLLFDTRLSFPDYGSGWFCGFEFQAFSEDSRPKDGHATSVTGNYLLVQLGRAVLSGSHFRICVLAGYFVGRETLTIEREPYPAYEAILGSPDVGARLTRIANLLSLGASGEVFSRPFAFAGTRIAVGIEIAGGFLVQPDRSHWETGDSTGGSATRVAGPYAMIGVSVR
jgi:hypothetical protein